MKYIKKIWRELKSFFVSEPDFHPLKIDESLRYGFFIAESQLPEVLKGDVLYVLTEDGIPWEAALICPCGCGTRLEMNLLPDEHPRWRYSVRNGLPSLYPSVNRKIECKSHFILRHGRIIWAVSRY
ncbi:MAG: hypothetical protein RL141_205 [Candidatus Parcubacteria bacterium]|jgi:hypothetical protein